MKLRIPKKIKLEKCFTTKTANKKNDKKTNFFSFDEEVISDKKKEISEIENFNDLIGSKYKKLIENCFENNKKKKPINYKLKNCSFEKNNKNENSIFLIENTKKNCNYFSENINKSACEKKNIFLDSSEKINMSENSKFFKRFIDLKKNINNLPLKYSANKLINNFKNLKKQNNLKKII